MTSSSKAVTPDSCRDQNVDTPSLPKSLGIRLLIVDDEPAHLKALAVMMEHAGMTCKTAPSAMLALSLLQKEPIDAVIADLNMPEVSGLSLLTEIRRHYPNMVFLMATGIEDVRIAVQAMQQGADDYLVKPLQMDVVIVSLERAFHKQSRVRHPLFVQRNERNISNPLRLSRRLTTK